MGCCARALGLHPIVSAGLQAHRATSSNDARQRVQTAHLPTASSLLKTMNSTAALTGSHLRNYQTIFQHPVSHNLGWQEVHALLRHIGQVEAKPNGNLKVTRNGQILTLPQARTKDVATTDELMALRHFLERSETVAANTSGREAHWLIVINHHEARIFQAEVNGGVPQQILPHAPADYFRHAPNSKDFTRGQEKPDPNSFFAPVAIALAGAHKILVFGSGTGTASEMDQFTVWLKLHHPALAKRIIGTVVVDEGHLTEAQLLAKAREFYAHAGISATWL